MSGFAGRAHARWAAVLPLAALLACVDVGLPGNTPEADAANREWRYRVYDIERAPDAPAEIASGDALADQPIHWLPSAESVEIPQALLRPVGGGSAPVYALGWDQEPYDQLYTPARRAGSYHPMHPVLPPAQPHEGGEAEAEHGAH